MAFLFLVRRVPRQNNKGKAAILAALQKAAGCIGPPTDCSPLLPLSEQGQRGDGEAFIASQKEFHRRLCIYPQFGDPQADLKIGIGQV